MKNMIKKTLILLFLAIGVYSCKPSDFYYADYLKDGEIYYPGRVDSLSIIPGDRKAKLRFRMTTDPKVNMLKIYVRNSLSAKIEKFDFPILAGEYGNIKEIPLNNLVEATYTVSVFTFATEVDSSRIVTTSQYIYGENYLRTLVNRTFSKIDKEIVNEHFIVFNRENNLPKEGVFYPMQYTEIRYKSTQGDSIVTQLTPYKEFASLKNIASPSVIEYRTAYKPLSVSLDYFFTPYKQVSYTK